MTKLSKQPVRSKIRLGPRLSLIFFVLASMLACTQNEDQNISIIYTNKQPTSIAIPKSLLKEDDSVEHYLQVRLKNNPGAMLGEYQKQRNRIVFQPLIPLSRGSTYEVFFRAHLVGRLDVPLDSSARAPRLLAVYPTTDVVPENLLKLYFQFSAPMREGEALQHIVLLNDNMDTLPDVFLNLQPELWNKERTVLTVWLDPGRIKRDLIPNRKMGNPLQNGHSYTLAVSGKWKDIQGIPLQRSYSRSITVGPRDSSSPQPPSWTIKVPEPGSTQPLKVIAGEPLDYFLLQETISILNGESKVVRGTIRVSDKETGFSFSPVEKWRPGHYKMRIAAHLEDLAGNNLERLFDRDVLAPQKMPGNGVGELEFVISKE